MQLKIKSILFAAGLGSDTGYVLDYALSLAQKYQARVHVIYGHETIDVSAQDMAELYMFRDDLEDYIEKSLQEREKRVRGQLQRICHERLAQIPAEEALIAGIDISRKPPKQAILDAAAECEADLIVMGAHRHSVLSDALLGSTTMKVLHSATVPVFIVRVPG